MNARQVTEDDLHAYVDGQLDSNRRLAVERWLADDGEAAARVEDYRAQTAMLHDLFDGVLREPPSDAVQDLTDRLKGRLAFNDNRPAWHARPLVRFAAAVLLLLAGAGGGWVGRGVQTVSPAGQQRQALATFAEEATQAHRFYTADERFQVELGADNQDELNGWLSKRVGRDVFGPDLGRIGFRLIGGRSLPTDLGAGAQYMYINEANKRITLFVGAPQSGNPSTFSFTQNGDVATFYWVEGALSYALAGRFAKEDLLEIAKAVYSDVKAGPPRHPPPSEPQQRPAETPPPQQPQIQETPVTVQPISDTQKPKDS
jgi:anti-sigma factor RsiW